MFHPFLFYEFPMTQYPINGDAFRALCDHAFWHNAVPAEDATFRHGDVVFCKIDEVWRLFRALRRTRKRIVLVTGEGDKPVTPELWSQKPPHVMHWFGTNMFVDNPSATPLPLGLGNAGDRVTLMWNEIVDSQNPPVPRTKLLYANFGTQSNPEVREPLLEWLQAPQQSWITRETQSGKSGYLSQLRFHRYVFCPPGNGEDTHRMWEALYCGAIPVVRKSPAMRGFRDLPILFVDDLMSVTPQLLESHTMTSTSSEMLDLSFWRNRIAEAREAVRSQGSVPMREWLQTWIAEGFRVLWKNKR